MIQLYFLLLIGLAQFYHQSYVQACDPAFECYAFADPHVNTWHLKGDPHPEEKLQHCYEGGFRVAVRNRFVEYLIKVSGRWMIDIKLSFFDGALNKLICSINSEHFKLIPGDAVLCQNNGVNWTFTESNGVSIMTVSYKRAEFLTTIQFDMQAASQEYIPHYNIYVWQPSSLAAQSSGFCTLHDPECILTARSIGSKPEETAAQPLGRTMTHNQAQAICEAHINAYLHRSRRAPYQRSTSANNTIAYVLDSCKMDVIFTGLPSMAASGVGVLMFDELTSDRESVASVEAAIDFGMRNALDVLGEATADAHADVSLILGTEINNPTTTTKPPVTTTTPIPSYKCGVYQDMYVQTWQLVGQTSVSSRSCSGDLATFELVKNNYLQYTLRTNGSFIDELTLTLFDESSTHPVCTISAVGENVDWMHCEQNGINPSLVKTTTHETLTVDYPQAQFSTVVTRNVGIFYGRFNILVYLGVDLALSSTGVCDLATPCAAARHAR